jgi:hypothetical protein
MSGIPLDADALAFLDLLDREEMAVWRPLQFVGGCREHEEVWGNDAPAGSGGSVRVG